MPKRKTKAPINRTQQYLTILTNLSILHSPCSSSNCQIVYKHCSGCNESFPCKTAQVLAGRTVAQINKEILMMQDSPITVYGDQQEQPELPFDEPESEDTETDV